MKKIVNKKEKLVNKKYDNIIRNTKYLMPVDSSFRGPSQQVLQSLLKEESIYG